MPRRAANLLLLGATLLLLEWIGGCTLGGNEHAILYDPSGGATGCCGQLRPSASTQYTGWFLRIPPVRQEVNALGYRGQARAQAKPSDVFRVAAVGDSYTYGLGTPSDDSIPAQVEGILRRGNVGPLEVLNFGVPGSQLADTIERVRCFAAGWHPDVILYFMYADDLEPALCEWKEVAQVGERLARGDVQALVSDWRNGLRLLVGVATWKSSLARATLLSYRLLSRWAAAADEQSWTTPLAEQVEVLAEVSQQSGASLMIVALGDPSAYRLSPHLGELLNRQSIPWLDGRAWLFGRADVRLPTIARDGHLNAEGNRVAAERVAEWLLRSGLVRAHARAWWEREARTHALLERRD